MLGQSDYEEQFFLADLHCICDSAYYTQKKFVTLPQSQITRVAITIFHYLWIKVIKINHQMSRNARKMQRHLQLGGMDSLHQLYTNHGNKHNSLSLKNAF